MNVPLLAAASLVTFRVLAQTPEPPQVLPPWPKGPPGFEGRRDEPERAESYWVGNVHQPSLTVFRPPPAKATGAAVVICQGSGHRERVFNAEGVQPGRVGMDGLSNMEFLKPTPLLQPATATPSVTSP